MLERMKCSMLGSTYECNFLGLNEADGPKKVFEPYQSTLGTMLCTMLSRMPCTTLCMVISKKKSLKY